MTNSGRNISSGLWRFYFEWRVLKWIIFELLFVALVIGAWQRSLGIAIFAFFGLLILTVIPILRWLISIALSVLWGFGAIGLAALFLKEEGFQSLSTFDVFAIGVAGFLIGLSYHAIFLRFASNQ